MADLLVRVPLWSATAVAAAGVLTSPAIDCRRADPDHMDFQITSVNSPVPSVKIQVRFSTDGVTFNPAASQADVVTATLTDYASDPEEMHILGVIPSASWIKLVVTELTSSVADTLVTAVLWLRESPVGSA